MESPLVISKLRSAMSLLQSGKLAEAEAEYREALKHSPRCSDALHFLGLVRHQRGDDVEALELMRRSIEISRNVASYHNNYGELLRADGRIDEAVAEFETALRLNPNSPQACNNLGIAADARGQTQDAIGYYERAICLKPDYGRAQWNRALALLLSGDYERGFEAYEWRFRDSKLGLTPRRIPRPLWDGSDLRGRTIFVHAEQGFGDTIQFVRYLPRLAAQGRVVMECQRELTGLVRRMEVASAVTAPGERPPAFDVHAPLLSLPRLLRTTAATIPANVPYLRADPQRVEQWRTRMASEPPGLRVGLAWAGRPTHWNDRNRSCGLTVLAPLLDVPGVRFYSLQKGEAAGQIAEAGFSDRITDWTAELHDFDDSAALVANLDLVIAVDTAIVHLAGALARPAWVLLTFQHDWRWMIGREDSPWYPTLRLFRQPAGGEWGRTIDSVAAALRKRVAETSSA